ncbi:MAG: CHAT domain-containing tetratricopeptide repeat protein [bacterium]
MKRVRVGQTVFLAVLLLVSCAAGADTANELARLNQKVIKLTQEEKYTEALSVARQALAGAEKDVGQENPITATCLNNLAAVYDRMGDYSAAEWHYKRALKIREAKLGPEHYETAAILNDLAWLYFSLGDYAAAEPCYQRALRIREAKLGSDHPDTAATLNNLALLYTSLGDYATAESLFLRAWRIKESKLGASHSSTVTSLNNLAWLYDLMRKYATAEQYYKYALRIRETTLGHNHRATAASLNALALVYGHRGNYSKAEQLFLDALKIRTSKLGADHPETATTLNNLAWLYECMGDYAKAEKFNQAALKITLSKLGPDHPATATSYYNLALLYISMGGYGVGRKTTAYDLAMMYKKASEKQLDGVLTFSSEHQRMAYQQAKNPYSLLATLGHASGLAETLLRTKGVILDSLLEDELVAEASKNPEIKIAASELRASRQRLNRLQLKPSEDFSLVTQEDRRRERELLEGQMESLQKMLARNVAAAGKTRRALRTTVPDVQAVLPKDTVLLEFIRYRHYLGKLKSERRYGVVLIGCNQVTFKDSQPGEPVWVPLGSAKAIEKKLKEYAGVMRGERGEAVLLRTLYAQLFEPIQNRLPKNITTLIISPDAELNFISFATLINDQNQFLAEQYAIEYVSSGRDLVLKRTSKKSSRRFAAFANPAFGEKPLLAGAHGTNTLQLAMLSSDQRALAADLNLGALPYTMQEAQFFRDRSSSWNMDGSVFAGAEASEAEVKAVHSPHILHLATHGFFFDDKLATTNRSVVPHNPMQRSGLAFAGAQLTLDAWKKGQTPNTENDGILMGQEIGTMDLKETWLVVLSACDTGIGEARAGEGVMGLRRGFIQAGTQNLLMTLWPVSDKWTVDLMKAFYERALKDNNAPQALAEVQRQWLARLRQEDVLTAARLAGPFILTFQGSN